MRISIRRKLIGALVAGAFLLGGCLSDQVASSPSASPGSSQPKPLPTVQVSPQSANLPRLEGEATVEMVVKGTPIILAIDGKNAPITAGNFVDLVKRGVYNGLVFHRVVREPRPFVVQAGDPQSKDPNFPLEQLGTGSFIDPETAQPRYVPLEIKPEGAKEPIYHQVFDTAGITKPPQLKHRQGAVAMARSSLPDSASSQFYITLSDVAFLDGSYAVFGYVTQGMEAVNKIQQGDRIESAKVVKGLENLKGGGK